MIVCVWKAWVLRSDVGDEVKRSAACGICVSPAENVISRLTEELHNI